MPKPKAVLVARETTELEAEILRGRLEADGIEAWLRGARVASTLGAVSEFNVSWNNPLGGVEVWVRAEDEEEANEILREVHARHVREKRNFPNALQTLVGLVAALFAWQTGSAVHPILGYAAAAAVLIGVLILSRK